MSSNVSDLVPPGEGAIRRKIDKLERRIRELEAGRSLESTTITGGTLFIKGGSIQLLQADGTLAVYIGTSVPPLGAGAGLILYRQTGEMYFALSGDPGLQHWGWFDEAGNELASDDAITGQGLARPYIPLQTMPTRFLSTLTAENTTSGAFVPLWTMQGHKQHPRLRVGLSMATSDGTTTGEIQLRDVNGATVIAGPTAVAATTGAQVQYELIGAIAGNHMGNLRADVEVRRTAGAGTVYAQLLYAEGVQS